MGFNGISMGLVGTWIEQGNYLGVTDREGAHHRGECATIGQGTRRVKALRNEKSADAARIVYMHDLSIVASIKAALPNPHHYMCPADIPPQTIIPE